MSTYDQLALPRCKETSLRLPIGAWEFRVETEPRVIARLVTQGWRIAVDYGQYKLLKYTHRETIE
jgi:hypothetical protein